MSDSQQTPSAFRLLPFAFREHRFALAFVFAVATIVFAAPLLKREVFTLRDHFDYFQPLRYFTAEELQAGRLPLWNPYNASGEPWMANPQTGVFYPPAWLFVILPFETAYVAFLLLHVMILGWGAYLLFARTAPQGAALAGAVAVMFSGPVFSLLDVQNNLATFAWVPLALWCAAEGAWRRGAIVLAMAFLGGEPFFAAIGAVLYVAVALRTKTAASAAALLKAAICAFGISAIQLLPFLDWLRASDRAAGLGSAAILYHSFRLRDWVRVAIPASEFWKNYILVPYIGISVLLLAIIGVTTLRKHRDVLAWLVLLAATIVVAAGPSLLAQLPLTLFRYPARLLPFASLAIAALAARGWQRIRAERRWIDLVVVLIILVDLVPRIYPLLATEPFQRHRVPYDETIGATSKLVRIGNEMQRDRSAWIAGYLNLYDHRFDAFTASPVISEPYLRVYRRMLANPSPPQLSGLGIGFVLTKETAPPPFAMIAREGEVRVYRMPAMPMAALFWREPITMRQARWKLDTSHARMTIDASHDGILVLRQQAQRGWSVTVDGKPAKSLVVDEIFRAVMLEKGRHEVVWTYDAPLFAIGIVMTILTLSAMQLSIIVKRSQR